MFAQLYPIFRNTRKDSIWNGLHISKSTDHDEMYRGIIKFVGPNTQEFMLEKKSFLLQDKQTKKSKFWGFLLYRVNL